ncbi:MAG: hypothetical protein JNK92_00125 [Dechloromonas sp.]|nr:hypothetical protein [Dechloromonas sp.]
MRAAHSFRHAAAGLVLALLAASTATGESCRIGYDMGSSGIRAGASGSADTTQVGIEYLDPLWAGRGLEETVAPTIAALNDLPREAGFPAGCARVGGGFSAWRLALEQDAERLADILTRIRAASAVAVLVIPQLQEGAYGYSGARQLLGDRLTTSHVLDIGGGSLQIAGEHSAWGDMLGQKAWHRRLCQEIRNAESVPCELQPMTGAELVTARSLLAKLLGGVAAALPGAVTLTAISRPVSRGVAPAVARLVPAGAGANALERPAISAAIGRIVGLTGSETMVATGNSSDHVTYLLSTMLLVEGVLLATGGESLTVAEVDLTNLPGLLADDRAFAWGQRHGCYLERLQTQGIGAYASDPATCP